MSVYFNEESYLDYKNMIITEAYIGRTPTLLEIEKQIGEVRAKAAKKFTDINRSEEVQKLNRLFEKQFGMDVFSLHVEQNNTINAYTIPIAMRFDIAFNEVLAKKIEANQKDGYRFKKGNNLCIICNIYMGLLMCPDMTDAEIVAVILHELGHNFADAIYKDIEIANKQIMKNVLNTIIFDAFITFGISLITELPYYFSNQNKAVNKKEKKESKKKQSNLKGILIGIKATCSDFNDYVSEVMSRLGGAKLFKLTKKTIDLDKVQKDVKKSLSRQNEVIGDKFAAIYGYGPELASGLLKMGKQVSKAEQFVKKIPGIGNKMNDSFNDAFKDIYKFDCHPHVIQRLNEEIKTLKAELEKSDLDPKLVQAMKKQVKQLENLLKEATKVSDKLPKDEKERAALFALINEQDPDAVDKEIEDKITKAFDDLLED